MSNVLAFLKIFYLDYNLFYSVYPLISQDFYLIIYFNQFLESNYFKLVSIYRHNIWK